MPAPGWYADPEDPTGGLRYWNGADWTDERAAPSPSQAEVKPPRDPEERRFVLVVALVLGAAVALIAFSVVVIVWFDSYNNGHSRGEASRNQPIPDDDVAAYCEGLAEDTTKPGSADGYWDLPWVWGCKRALD